MANSCKVCGKEDAKRCGKCHKVFYCSVTCQKKDWKSHKEACSSSLQVASAPIESARGESDDLPKAIFSEPFTLEKFIPHVNQIKQVTKRCVTMWVGLRMIGKMPIDSSLPTCFVYYTREGFVREHMICMEGPPPLQMLQKIVDSYQAHAFSISAEIRYRHPQTMAVMKEGVVLQVGAKGFSQKFFFDQTRGGRSANGVLLSVSDPEECHISLFDSTSVKFY